MGVTFGSGSTGLWIFLFIISKFPELFDTFFIVVNKKRLIFLHWYHHVTVLLYCWHSYASRIGTGLWFASMNYTVHSVMYFYFGLTQLGPTYRKMVKRFSVLVTMLQLTQMMVGIAVTVASIGYHARGDVCYV